MKDRILRLYKFICAMSLFLDSVIFSVDRFNNFIKPRLIILDDKETARHIWVVMMLSKKALGVLLHY